MEFEYDLVKSVRNNEKHGIDFKEAKALWDDDDRLVFPARSDTEKLFAMLAELDAKIWVAFYTIREDRVRIISVRRARPKEKEEYDSRRTR